MQEIYRLTLEERSPYGSSKGSNTLLIFGENLTVSGLSEEMVNVGDRFEIPARGRFQVGSVELIAT